MRRSHTLQGSAYCADPSERALFTQRRKEAYEALHPETKHGENQHTRSRQLGDSSTDRFTADTATRTGQSERALFTQRRKEAYEALHPETRHGANQHTRSPQNEDSKSFADDTALRTGQSRQTIERDAHRGSKISDEALAAVKGTDLDKGTVLDAIAGISPLRPGRISRATPSRCQRLDQPKHNRALSRVP
ncbi:hypothetical protein [Acidiphilium sp. 34-64-41]|uniref:hypothetical protein n=1 Tax=Acidiphilium sp. 34-64-41 TaxID=1970297 RepID=UPI000BC79342|nr:hypothetical protein [Acidiphilium sp. 34-64-41]OZB28217.1 MAG: hypothetical protein B7X49_10030 [Acidiphilium sp. 34-64-41]